MQLNNEGGAGMNEEEDEEELGHHLNNDQYGDEDDMEDMVDHNQVEFAIDEGKAREEQLRLEKELFKQQMGLVSNEKKKP